MDYKQEYLNEKKKYIELRNYIATKLGQIQQTGGNLDADDNVQEGSAIPAISSPNTVVILFKESDLNLNDADQKGKIKELIYMPVESRSNLLDNSYGKLNVTKIGDTTINLDNLFNALANKAYILKVGDNQATLVKAAQISKPQSPQLSRGSQPTAPTQQKTQVTTMTKQMSLPNMKLMLDKSGMSVEQQKIAKVCIDNYTSLSDVNQKKCMLILQKLTGGGDKDEQTSLFGAGFFDSLSAFFGGELNETMAAKVEMTDLANKKTIIALLNKLGSGFDTAIVLEKIPGTEKARIIRIYRKDYDMSSY